MHAGDGGFIVVVCRCMDRVMAEDSQWGIMFFRHDWFSAVRTDVVRQVRFDTFIHHYKSDCDFYARVRAAGWHTSNHKRLCPDVHVEVWAMCTPVLYC